MKKLNKKGFTIVELVIVIAVIAILSAVLVPTFTGIVQKAQESARQQRATSAYHVALGESEEGTFNDNAEGTAADLYIEVTDNNVAYYFSVVDGVISEETTTAPTDLATAYGELNVEETLNGIVIYQPNA